MNCEGTCHSVARWNAAVSSCGGERTVQETPKNSQHPLVETVGGAQSFLFVSANLVRLGMRASTTGAVVVG